MKKIRLGVIGAGKMATKRHLPALLKIADSGACELVVVCDLNSELAANAGKQFGFAEVTTDADSVISRGDIDAVCLFATPKVHYQYGVRAMKQGKDVFVEKPPAESVTQLTEMTQVARQTERVICAGFNRRFHASIQKIKHEVRSDSILTADASFNKSNAGVVSRLGMTSWLNDSGVHALDVLCYVMGGMPTEVYSFYNGGSVEKENFTANMVWADGRSAVFTSNNSAGARLERYTFHTYGATYTIDGSNLTTDRGGVSEVVPVVAGADGGIIEELSGFVKAVQERNFSSIQALETTIPTMRLLELIESGYKGEIASVAPADKGIDLETLTESEETTTKFSRVENMSVLILNPNVLGAQVERLHADFQLVYPEQLTDLSPLERKNIVAMIAGGPGSTVPDETLFDQLPGLQVLGVVGATVQKWGGDTAVARDIAIFNTADVYAEAVAEFVVMQTLIGLRRASVSHEVMRRGGWGFRAQTRSQQLKLSAIQTLKKSPIKFLKPYLSFMRPVVKTGSRGASRQESKMLKGRTVALIGYGEITKKTIPLFNAFGCEVLVYSDHLTQRMAEELRCRKASLAEALRADVVSMQRGLSKRTYKSFSAAEINALRPGTVFVNAGRAGLVDNDALKERLKRGDIFACLDVFDKEPPEKGDTFRSVRNVFLSSHIAGSINHVDELKELSSERLVDKIIAYITDNTSVQPISASQIENMT